MAPHNPFENPETVADYEAWYRAAGRRAARQEKALLRLLLSHFPMARSLLEVGCGTGHFTHWFAAQGLQTAGVDLSGPMLEEAKRLNCPACVRGDALKLPFHVGAFDLVVLITTLEFLTDPIRALTEAIRVARQGLILGVLNAKSHLGRAYKLEGGPIWEVAHLFTPDELKRMIREVCREKPTIIWRTTLWPLPTGALPFPWGGFIGMAVKLS